jgi:3'(2'), 5'-bisphosphate nucleotidase
MTQQDLPLPDASLDDASLAVALAEGAGRVLLALRADASSVGTAHLRDAGDAAAQAWIAAGLAVARPADVVLSEEAADDPARHDADRVWIVDPLDGTREFGERAPDGGWRDDFAVHVALWERGAGLTTGAVGLPARGTVYATAEPVAPADPPDEPDRPLRIAASRTRPPHFVTELAARGDVELVPMGSAGVKVTAVVDGTVDAYVHAGGQFEWDSAAPVAVALAAGLVCTRLDGSSLEYNRRSPWLPDLFVSRPAVAPRLRAALLAVGVDIKEGAQP